MTKKSISFKLLALVTLFLFLICSATLVTNAKKDLKSAVEKLENIDSELQSKEYNAVMVNPYDETVAVTIESFNITDGVITDFTVEYKVSGEIEGWWKINIEDTEKMLGVVDKYFDRDYTYTLSVEYPIIDKQAIVLKFRLLGQK